MLRPLQTKSLPPIGATQATTMQSSTLPAQTGSSLDISALMNMMITMMIVMMMMKMMSQMMTNV